MLKDSVRTRAYMAAISQSAHLMRGKTVLDIGCGTGILSLFAAKAGAARVFGIECSSIAEQATQIVAANGYSNVVTIIHGKVEEIELPVDKVDVIISEWMGYFLLYESMLDTVLYARDKWLAPGGALLPDRCSLHVAAIEDGEYRQEKIDFWDNVYGFDMKVIKSLAMSEPLVDVVNPEQVNTDVCDLATFDLSTMARSEQTFEASFSLTASRNDYVHAIVAYFDVAFDACHKPVRFSTGPHARPTHWKQTVFYLDDMLTVNEGETVRGVLRCKPNGKNPRDLDIELEYHFEGAHCEAHRTQHYRMR